MIDYRIIGIRIRRQREEKMLTQEELAFRIGTSAAYISNVERGVKKASLQTLVEIADAMELTVNDFIYDLPYSSKIAFDIDMMRIIAMCTPEKQRCITKNIAEIIKIFIAQ